MTKGKEQVSQCGQMKLEKYTRSLRGSQIRKSIAGYVRVQTVLESTREPWKIVNRRITSLGLSFERSLQLSRLAGGSCGKGETGNMFLQWCREEGLDVTKSRGMRDTGTLGRYLCTRIDRTGRLMWGCCWGSSKQREGSKVSFKFLALVTCQIVGPLTANREQRRRNQLREGLGLSEHATDLTQITFAVFFPVIFVLS